MPELLPYRFEGREIWLHFDGRYYYLANGKKGGLFLSQLSGIGWTWSAWASYFNRRHLAEQAAALAADTAPMTEEEQDYFVAEGWE